MTPAAFGRYRVTATLGAGAMGEVYLAVDDVLGREVAIKTLRADAAPGGLGARILDERFRIEARAIAQLAHPSIVAVFDLDPTADPPYLVMERVSGPSLKERLETGALPVGEAIAMGIQIANALAAAHAASIVHRDVKPANILIAGAGNWKLADFGVAHVPDSSLTMTGQFVGSPAYAPPEALVQGISSSAGDIYGLGATLYQAIAGTWPRLDGTTTALLAPVPPLRSLAPDVPDELAAVVDRAVAMDAAQRPTAVQLANALASRPSREIATAAATFPGGRLVLAAGPRTARPWRMYAIAGGALAVVLVIAIAASRGGTPPPQVQPAEAAPAVVPPEPARDDRHARDGWRKVEDRLDDEKYGEALDEIAKWQREFDPDHLDPTANALRDQLEAMPPGQLKKKGPKKKGKHDD